MGPCTLVVTGAAGDLSAILRAAGAADDGVAGRTAGESLAGAHRRSRQPRRVLRPVGPERAPDPHDTYTRSRNETQRHESGDDRARRAGPRVERQAGAAERPGEPRVRSKSSLSRVLSAVGYHQPPVYFLPSFTLVDDWGTHIERGGRFRLNGQVAQGRGEWSWQQNPFVGTRPYQGLLVILLMFNSSRSEERRTTRSTSTGTSEGVEQWYVVRDLGSGARRTGRLAPTRGDPDVFERQPFITRRQRRLRHVQLSRLASGADPGTDHARRSWRGRARCSRDSMRTSGKTRSAPVATRARSPTDSSAHCAGESPTDKPSRLRAR